MSIPNHNINNPTMQQFLLNNNNDILTNIPNQGSGAGRIVVQNQRPPQIAVDTLLNSPTPQNSGKKRKITEETKEERKKLKIEALELLKKICTGDELLEYADELLSLKAKSIQNTGTAQKSVKSTTSNESIFRQITPSEAAEFQEMEDVGLLKKVLNFIERGSLTAKQFSDKILALLLRHIEVNNLEKNIFLFRNSRIDSSIAVCYFQNDRFCETLIKRDGVNKIWSGFRNVAGIPQPIQSRTLLGFSNKYIPGFRVENVVVLKPHQPQPKPRTLDELQQQPQELLNMEFEFLPPLFQIVPPIPEMPMGTHFTISLPQEQLQLNLQKDWDDNQLQDFQQELFRQHVRQSLPNAQLSQPQNNNQNR